MTDDLIDILSDLLALCDAGLNATEQVLMLDAEGLPQAQKEKRLAILKSIGIAQDGCKATLARVEALKGGAAQTQPVRTV